MSPVDQSPNNEVTQDLPPLVGEYPLSEEQIQSFRSEGFVILRGVLTSGEIEAYRKEIKRATFELNNEKRKLEERDAYGKAFLQTLNLRLYSQGVMKLVSSPRIGKIYIRA